jgi:hypothetical protein
VGSYIVVADSERKGRGCVLAMLFYVFAALAVVAVLALVGALYFLARRWL